MNMLFDIYCNGKFEQSYNFVRLAAYLSQIDVDNVVHIG